MRTLGSLAALLVLLAAAPVGAQPKAAVEKGSTGRCSAWRSERRFFRR